MSNWEPRIDNSIELIDAAPVAALSALLDSGAPEVGFGDALPPLWHWVALPRWSPSSMSGFDGHPQRGDFLPPVELPRRMFAGGEVTMHGELLVGDEVVRQSVVESIENKQGRSGSLVVVHVLTTLSTEQGHLLLEERQDLVYREAPTATKSCANPDQTAELSPKGPPLTHKDNTWQFVTDPTLLMRFSAATANAHRIHYDWPYATQVEGYPGLVVQGPFSTIVLAELLRLELPQRPVARLRHRNFAPLFCGELATVELSLESSDAEVTLRHADQAKLAVVSAQLKPKGKTS